MNESLVTNSELVRRFEQEARLAGPLNHPNLVAVFDVGHHDGSPFLVTELLQGESLRERLSRGPIPVKTALDWAAQLALGLAAAHARGVVHRDVKPDNIFVGSGALVKLLDFGIAKLNEVAPLGFPPRLDGRHRDPHRRGYPHRRDAGDPGVHVPRAAPGESVDARSDVFSLGAVIHEMLSGHRPFPGSLVESGYAILHHEPAPLSDELPPVLVQVVNRCLEKAPARRFQSASDLAFDLELLRDPTSTGRGGPDGMLVAASAVPILATPSWERALLFSRSLERTFIVPPFAGVTDLLRRGWPSLGWAATRAYQDSHWRSERGHGRRGSRRFPRAARKSPRWLARSKFLPLTERSRPDGEAQGGPPRICLVGGAKEQ